MASGDRKRSTRIDPFGAGGDFDDYDAELEDNTQDRERDQEHERDYTIKDIQDVSALPANSGHVDQEFHKLIMPSR